MAEVKNRVNESAVDKQYAAVLSELFGKKVTVGQAQEAQDAYQALIVDNLALGKNVSLHGFGVFELRDVPAKVGVSFGKRFDNPAYKAVKFRSFAAFDEAINPEPVAEVAPAVAEPEQSKPEVESPEVDAPMPLPVPSVDEGTGVSAK